MIKQLAVIILLSVSYNLCFSQAEIAIDSLERKAIEQYKQRLDNIFSEERDSIFAAYDSTIYTLFQKPEVCGYPFERFSEYVSIVTSPDNKLRSFSWDNVGGGSFHDYTTYLEYKKPDGSCGIVEIDTEKSDQDADFIEVRYYKIEQIKEATETYYFLLGYGTYGGGKQHQAIRVFQLTDDIVAECFSCYPENKPLVMYRNRVQEIELTYSEKERRFTFREYEFDNDVGFYTDDFRVIELAFKNGKLIRNQ